MTPVASAITGFTHYIEHATGADYLYVNTVPMTVYCRDSNRSWIFVWENNNAVSGKTLSQSQNRGTTGNGWGQLAVGVPGGSFKTQYNGGTTKDLTAANATGHSTSGTPADLLLAAGNLCLLIISYDPSLTVLTFRWKQTANIGTSGHTYLTQATTAETAAGSKDLNFTGDTGGFSANTVRWRYIGIVDRAMTAANFDILATAAGL
jgi:hypothetical protein